MAGHPALGPDRVAVITGAASGFGAAMAKRFSQEGARVLAGDWNGGALAALCEELASECRPVQAFEVDVANADAVAKRTPPRNTGP